MSPSFQKWYQWYQGFPRVSGDEPVRLYPTLEIGSFSPRERG